MLQRISAHNKAFSAISAEEAVVVGEATYYPLLTHHGGTPNPLHALLTGRSVGATPYYFLDQGMRDAALAIITGG